MQRLSALLLLVLFSFSLVVPAAFADFESQLPACCRRLGQHHCSTTQNLDQASGSTVQAVSQKCLFFPLGRAVPAHGKTTLLGAAQTIVASLVSHPTGPAQTEARYRVSFSRSHPKRGPPSLPTCFGTAC